jgi:hypothetical protein
LRATPTGFQVHCCFVTYIGEFAGLNGHDTPKEAALKQASCGKTVKCSTACANSPRSLSKRSHAYSSAVKGNSIPLCRAIHSPIYHFSSSILRVFSYNTHIVVGPATHKSLGQAAESGHSVSPCPFFGCCNSSWLIFLPSFRYVRSQWVVWVRSTKESLDGEEDSSDLKGR